MPVDVTYWQYGTGCATTSTTAGSNFWPPSASTGAATMIPIQQPATTGYICILTTSGTGGIEPLLPGWNCAPTGTAWMQRGPALSRAELDLMIDEHRREAETSRQRRVRARDRALELLMSVLSEEQAWSYQANRYFEVQGSAGGWWRIRRDGQAGNVDELEEPHGDRIASWCCHPPGGLPDADAHLAQLLQLETDEPGFRRTGNRTPRRRLAVQAA